MNDTVFDQKCVAVKMAPGRIMTKHEGSNGIQIRHWVSTCHSNTKKQKWLESRRFKLVQQNQYYNLRLYWHFWWRHVNTVQDAAMFNQSDDEHAASTKSMFIIVWTLCRN